MLLEKDAQAATEYLMIMVIAMLVLVPLVSVVYSRTGRSRRELGLSALSDSLQGLADAADMVQAQGSPATITRTLHLPEGTQYTNVTENHFLARVETGAGPTDFPAKTSANLTGDLPDEPGSYRVKVKMEENGVVNVTY
ncbi:MAG: hypothetical protein ACLFM9_04095 [Candidatus Aenigmatarchaeota archaeon]